MSTSKETPSITDYTIVFKTEIYNFIEYLGCFFYVQKFLTVVENYMHKFCIQMISRVTIRCQSNVTNS